MRILPVSDKASLMASNIKEFDAFYAYSDDPSVVKRWGELEQRITNSVLMLDFKEILYIDAAVDELPEVTQNLWVRIKSNAKINWNKKNIINETRTE